MPFATVQPVIDLSVRGLCARPYPGHPHGCPNFAVRTTCPPVAASLRDLLDLSLPIVAVWNVFDLASHVERMRAAHPRWSDRQLVNCLYWQQGAREELRKQVQTYRTEHLRLLEIYCPEACGVNVTETMRSVGVELQWPPRDVAYQVAMVGTRAGVREQDADPAGQLALL